MSKTWTSAGIWFAAKPEKQASLASDRAHNEWGKWTDEERWRINFVWDGSMYHVTAPYGSVDTLATKVLQRMDRLGIPPEAPVRRNAEACITYARKTEALIEVEVEAKRLSRQKEVTHS